MESMKKVTRYECKFCKKDFKTPDKHRCKFNPILKNCFTCKYLKGWHDSYYSDEYAEPPYPDCAVDEGEHWDIEEIKSKEYNMKCEKYEEGKYDWSKGDK